jgi:hypothetical protein
MQTMPDVAHAFQRAAAGFSRERNFKAATAN